MVWTVILAFAFACVSTKANGTPDLLNQIKGRAQGPEIIGARAGRDQNQVGEFKDLPVLFRERRGRIDETICETRLAESAEPLRQFARSLRARAGAFSLADVPPGCECLLGVSVDENSRAVIGEFNGDRQVRRKRGLAATAFLGSNHNCFHWISHQLKWADFRDLAL